MGQGIAQILVFVAILVAASYAYSAYLARVFADGDGFLSRGRLRFLGGAERGFFRAIGDRTAKEPSRPLRSARWAWPSPTSPMRKSTSSS